MFTDEQFEDDEIPKCRCGKPGLEAHPCPYDQELNPDRADRKCNCCSKCRTECAMDV